MRKQMPKTQMTGKQQETHEVEVQSYAPNISLTPRDYELSAHLLDLEMNFHSIVQVFFKNTNIDEFNATYIDGVISSAEREALADLGQQKADHIGKINHLIEKIWRGDKIKAESKLAQNKRELQECERTLKQLERIYYHGTSMEGEGVTALIEKEADV